MDLRELYERGLELRRRIFGNETVEKRMKAFGEFGEPLQNIVNAYCGIPAANEAHRIAHETITSRKEG